MEKFATVLFLMLQCFTCIQCLDSMDPAQIETFYPPLNSSQHVKPLVFGLIMSFGGNLDSSGVVPGVRVALDRINNDTSLLRGYLLHYALSDSQVRLMHAMNHRHKQYVHYAVTDRNYHMLCLYYTTPTHGSPHAHSCSETQILNLA